MQTYYTSEPCIRTMGNDSSGFASYQLYEVTGMQDDIVTNGSPVYNGTAYCPDGNEDLDFMPTFRSMIGIQVGNLSRLIGWNSQTCILTQSTFAFNTYFTVHDDNTGVDTDYSVVYDTRGLTAYEAGAANLTHYPGQPYSANLYPDPEILHGQWFNLTYRNPSNRGETEAYDFGFEYETADTSTSRHYIDRVTGQSFRYSGAADWQEWTDSVSGIVRGRFYRYNPKTGYEYITGWLLPRWCDEPDTVYLYWLNSLGGIEFVRGVLEESIEHEDSVYETNATIADYRDGWGEAVYSQRKWRSYSFRTSLVSDKDSPNVADVCGSRFAWLYFPGRIQPWKTVRVNDAQATVKTFRNQGNKLYNYTFELEDSVKAKTV